MEKKQNEKDNANDIFIKAATDSVLNSGLAKVKSKEEELQDSNEELSKKHTSEGSKWDNLAKYIDGDGAQRVMDELKSMGGRDFVRNYLKVLEHFRPKLTRVEAKPIDEVDTVINIQLVKLDVNGNKVIINALPEETEDLGEAKEVKD